MKGPAQNSFDSRTRAEQQAKARAVIDANTRKAPDPKLPKSKEKAPKTE